MAANEQMAANVVNNDKFWFVLNNTKEKGNREDVARVYSEDGGKKRLYYERATGGKKFFTDVEDCRRLISLCDMYLSGNDRVVMQGILANCANAGLNTAILDNSDEKIRKENEKAEEKAKVDREFIIQTVGNMDIADILISKFAKLTDADNIKAKKLRSMHAAMRATQLINKDVKPTDIFNYSQYEEAGTTEKLFRDAFTKDKAILKEAYAKERIKIKGSREFIAKTAVNSLISYSLIECFDPIDKDDPYYALAMKEMYDGRKVAALSAIEFAGGRTSYVSGATPPPARNTNAGNKALLDIQTAELKRKHAAEEKLLKARAEVTKKRDRTASTAQAGAASSSKKPKVDEDKEAEADGDEVAEAEAESAAEAEAASEPNVFRRMFGL